MKKTQQRKIDKEVEDHRSYKKEGGEEQMSEIWTNEEEEEGNFLIARLIDEPTSHPWVVAHQGMHQIFRSSLFVPIVETNEKEKVLSIFLRDHANRGTSRAIRRKFYLKFASENELECFKFFHNSILESSEGRGERGEGGGVDAKRKHRDSEEDVNGDGVDKDRKSACDSSEEDGGPPVLKRRKITSSQDEEADDDGDSSGSDKEIFKSKLEMLKRGDGNIDHFDDQFDETQDPFAVDDSF